MILTGNIGNDNLGNGSTNSCRQGLHSCGPLPSKSGHAVVNHMIYDGLEGSDDFLLGGGLVVAEQLAREVKGGLVTVLGVLVEVVLEGAHGLGELLEEVGGVFLVVDSLQVVLETVV